MSNFVSACFYAIALRLILATLAIQVLASPLPMQSGESSNNRWWISASDDALIQPPPQHAVPQGSLPIFSNQALYPHWASGASSGSQHSPVDTGVSHHEATGSSMTDSNHLVFGTPQSLRTHPDHMWLNGHHWIPVQTTPHDGSEILAQATQHVSRPSEPSLSSIFEQLSPIRDLGSSADFLKHQPMHDNTVLFPALHHTGVSQEQALLTGWQDTPHNRAHSHDDVEQEFEDTDESSRTRTTEEATTLIRNVDTSQSALGLLQQHPAFTVLGKSDKYKQLPMADEMSPRAHYYKQLINTHLFDNKLEWGTKGDYMINAQVSGTRFRRFIRRIQERMSFVTAYELVGAPDRIVAVPHRVYKEGSVMFDPEPFLSARRLHVSFWAPSHDARYPRLLHVGSAALRLDDAITLLGQDERHAPGQHFPAISGRKVVSPSEQSRSVVSPQSPAVTVAARDWLRDFPLVQRIDDEDVVTKLSIAANLVSAKHTDSQALMKQANLVLFGGNVAWQSRPEEVVLDAAQIRSRNILRFHKNASALYLTKPSVSSLLRRHMVLIPYRVHTDRARLFDSSLAGKSHAFTLWASRGSVGGPESDVFDFVGGGTFSPEKTDTVIKHAQAILDQIAGPMVHGQHLP